VNLMVVSASVLLAAGVAAGAPEPWPRRIIDAAGKGADGVRVADVSGDGLPDVAAAWEEGGRVRVYIHPGASRVREPWPAVTVGRVASPEDAVFADLDGDGAIDVVSSCEGRERAVHVHWAPKDPVQLLRPESWRTEAVPAALGREMWMYALPIQLDGRRGSDLVLGSKERGGSVSWLEAPEDPRRLGDWRLRPLRGAGWVMSLIAVDLDRDGDLDVLGSDRKGERRGVFCLENAGASTASGEIAWKERSLGLGERETMFLDCADWNRDGRLDVLAAVKPRDVVLLLQPERREEAWRRESISLPGPIGNAKAVRAADLDLDGRLDLVFSCEGAAAPRSGVAWYAVAPGAASSAAPVFHDISGPEGTKFDRLELLDLDADGDLDVLTTEERDGLGVFWYENPARAAPGER
jgi:hypothetical protein